MKRLRLMFWTWVHDRLEIAWHWVYYRKMVPLMPPPPMIENQFYYAGEDEDHVYYRSNS